MDTKSWKFYKKMRFWLKNIHLSKQHGARRLLSELSDKAWKLGSIYSVLNRLCKRPVQLSGNHASVDRVRRVAVEDLVLSQEDKPKRHQSAREISHETAILHSNVHRIFHRDLQLKCFKWRHAQLISETIFRFIRW